MGVQVSSLPLGSGEAHADENWLLGPKPELNQVKGQLHQVFKHAFLKFFKGTSL